MVAELVWFSVTSGGLLFEKKNDKRESRESKRPAFTGTTDGCAHCPMDVVIANLEFYPRGIGEFGKWIEFDREKKTKANGRPV